MKRLILFLSILALLTSVCACAHAHEQAEEYKNDESFHWNPCDDEGCDYKFNKSEHAWGEGEVTTKPTSTKDGVMSYLCSVCKRLKQEPIKYNATPTVTPSQWKNAFFLSKFNNVEATLVETVEYDGVVNKREYKIQASEEAVYVTIITYENGKEISYDGKYQEGTYLWVFTDKNQKIEDITPTHSMSIMRPVSVLTDNGFDKLGDMFDSFAYNESTGCYESSAITIEGVGYSYKNVAIKMGDGNLLEIKVTTTHNPSMSITVSYSNYGGAKPTPPMGEEKK